MCSLADMYLNGIGCEENLENAIRYFEMAALQGETLASERLIALVSTHSLMENYINCGHAARAA
jgi:TPR repeat protein